MTIDTLAEPPVIGPKERAIFQDPRKRWSWIMHQIDLRDSTLADLARSHVSRKTGRPWSRKTLEQVATRRFPLGQQVIADFLKVPVTVLFPDRYDADGLPIRGWRGRKATAKTVNKKRATHNRAKAAAESARAESVG
jgi:lambda repressor-like predicted transcriptional regulator